MTDDNSLPMSMPHHGSVGAVLAAARAQRGVELIDVARETRVPLRHLKALEADAHDSLPALPYTIGFVKSYARAVGIDPEAAAAQFRGETSKTAHVPAHAPLEPLDARRLPSRGLVAGSVAAVVVLLAGIWAYSAGWFEPAPPAEVIAAAPLPEDTQVTAAGAPALPSTEDALAETDIGSAMPPTSIPAAGTVTPVAGAPAATGAVTLTPTEDVWVKIYQAGGGAAVKTGVLKARETYVVPGDPAQLMLWTGKAGVLGLAVGGRPIAPLGGPVETVRDVSLAPAALAGRRVPIAAQAAVLQ